MTMTAQEACRTRTTLL